MSRVDDKHFAGTVGFQRNSVGKHCVKRRTHDMPTMIFWDMGTLYRTHFCVFGRLRILCMNIATDILGNEYAITTNGSDIKFNFVACILCGEVR